MIVFVATICAFPGDQADDISEVLDLALNGVQGIYSSMEAAQESLRAEAENYFDFGEITREESGLTGGRDSQEPWGWEITISRPGDDDWRRVYGKVREMELA